MTSLISALLMIFIMAVIAATFVLALYRMLFWKRKRKIYAHQVVKHAADPLPYQLENYGVDLTTDEAPSQEFINLVASGKQKLDQANEYAAKCAESAERHRQENLNAIHNGLESDSWMRRVNR